MAIWDEILRPGQFIALQFVLVLPSLAAEREPTAREGLQQRRLGEKQSVLKSSDNLNNTSKC